MQDNYLKFTTSVVGLISLVLLSITACDQLGVEKPTVAKGHLSPVVDHTNITENCVDCHETDRPYPVGDIAHGEGKDCFNCHEYSATEGWSNLTSFDHTPSPTACSKCHEPVRPALPHIAAVDCVECHAYNKWSLITFSHTPEPEKCVTCHEVDRPAKPHTTGGDCNFCHTNPDWKVVKTFDHIPLPKACVACHEDSRPAAPHDKKGECAGCHSHPDWANATSFNHLPLPDSCNVCHTKDRPATPHPTDGDCAECHTFPTFKAAIYAHDPKPDACGEYCHARPTTDYNRGYPNQGPPIGFAAGDPGSGHLAGKDCVECHGTPPEGVTAWGFDHSKPTLTFCLPCHYNTGEAKHGTANMNIYTLDDFGNCNSCHKSYDKSTERNWGT